MASRASPAAIGAFVVGAIAALTSKSGKLGFIGGMDIPLIRRFQLGYEAGAKFINKDVSVLSNYAGVTGDAWNNPPKGKELALAQFGAGADVIFAAAGATGMGLFDAAEEKKKLAIGVDSNQNHLHPGHVLTSMLKRVDNATYDAMMDVQNGEWSSGVVVMGLSEDGVGYAVDENNEALITPEMKEAVEAAKAKIISGEIEVHDYMSDDSCPVS